MFCGHDPICTEVGNPEALARAKENVAKDYPIIGVLEHFSESLKLYESALPQFFRGIVEVNNEDFLSQANLSLNLDLQATFYVIESSTKVFITYRPVEHMGPAPEIFVPPSDEGCKFFIRSRETL